MNALVTTPNAGTVEVIRFEDGIHFGVPEDSYHKDDALGSTTLKALVLDPIEYQHQRLHGGERAETFALKWGSAIHCRVLEGRASMAERFPISPSIKDYVGILNTNDDLQRHCRTIGITPGKLKSDTIARIREIDTDVLIWDEVIAKFEADNVGRTIIPRDALEHIERAAQWMQRDRKLAPVMEDGTFTAGASEVSIFYTENGIRLKARLDHLLAHAAVDLKSFRAIMAEALKPAAKRAVSRMRYDLQAASYIRALRAAAKLYAQGKVFNNPYKPEFLDQVFKTLAADGFQWIWVLIKASGAPQSVVAEFDTTSMIFRTAEMQINDAIKNYRALTEKFGPDQDWVPDNDAEVWGDTDFSPWSFQ